MQRLIAERWDLSNKNGVKRGPKKRVIASTLPACREFAKDREENVNPARICFDLFCLVSPLS